MSILVENLTKKYGEQTAVDNLSFEVKTGEVVGFLGPNGAGKSTMMKIITCYLSPNQGDVRLGNHSIHSDSAAIKQKIGYLPEHNPLYLDMYIVDYLRFCAALQGVPSGKIKQCIEEMISLCGLKEERHKKIGELSKGYRQRVGLAQAMVHDPAVLILDEPTSGLDPNQRIEIRNLIQRLGEKKTIILSSHILSEVEATCERILIINKGIIVADGTAAALQQARQPHERLQLRFSTASSTRKEALLQLSDLAKVETVNEETGEYLVESKPDRSSKKAIFDLCVSEGSYLLNLQEQSTTLEDVFKDLTK